MNAVFSRQTLARRLLLTVFPWYLVLTVLMTCLQLGVQYASTRQDIMDDLATLGRTVQAGVTDAMWELDKAKLGAIARGVRSNAIVSGVTVRSESGEVLVYEGQLTTPQNQEGSFFIQETVPLMHESGRGQERLIGYLDLYSSRDVLWNRIKYSFVAKLLDSVIVAAGLWLIFSLTIHYRLSRSVTQLANAVRGWQFRGTDAPIQKMDYPYRDELGQLVTAMAESQSRLLQSLQQLGDVNQNLEKLVTERTEDLLVAKEAAESADRLKSAFLATMSHELRTPLNSIIGFTGILTQGLAGPLNEEQAKQLGMVRTSARHLLALINDVLDISKIEAGELTVACEPFSLQTSVEKVLGLMHSAAQKKGLALQLQVGNGLAWAQMRGDARRVEQVLFNLLGNAIKFTDTGAVTLTVDRIDMPCGSGPSPVQAGVRLRITDTGMGIKPEDMALLFKPFRQIDSTLARQHEGTGLGLAICHRLVTLMGGSIEAHSIWQRGSTFTVVLPMQSAGPVRADAVRGGSPLAVSVSEPDLERHPRGNA